MLTAMYDRSVIGEVSFDETYERHEDYKMWLSILKRGIVANKIISNIYYSL